MMVDVDILLTIKLGQELFADPKRIALLGAIRQSGSINQAAKRVNVSYKSAWDHLEAMNQISPKPLFERNTGGKNGGGTILTPYAERLLQLYALLQHTQHNAFRILQDESIPLDSLLNATAHFSPKSSARNQFLGKVSRLVPQEINCDVEINIADFPSLITACITQHSVKELDLYVGKEVILLIKAPWVNIHLTPPTQQRNCFLATVKSASDKALSLVLEGGIVCHSVSDNPCSFEVGQQVWCSIAPEQIILMTL